MSGSTLLFLAGAARSANNFSNGEIISFADEFTALGEFAGEDLQMIEPRQNLLRIARATHDFPNRLLQRFDFDFHGATLSLVRGKGQPASFRVLGFAPPWFCRKWVREVESAMKDWSILIASAWLT